MKRYKLLRDLPTFKAGDTFILTGLGDLILEKPEPPHEPIVYAYNHTTLQKFPNILEDWFGELSEPLIKDEKIRKAVRVWAETLGIKAMDVRRHNSLPRYTTIYGYTKKIGEACYRFEIPDDLSLSLKTYTTEELCGEEE